MIKKIAHQNYFFKFFCTQILVIFFFLFAPPVFAQSSVAEQITNFEVSIQIEKNNILKIKEQIEYYFSSPQHGIYRYFPYHYEDKENNRYLNLDYEFLDIRMDGVLIEYQKNKTKGNWLLKIGDPHSTISGSHLFTINYQVKYALNYFFEYDELYWNITGSGWEVPIKQIGAEVILPENIEHEKLKAQCFTQASDHCEVKKKDGKVEFMANGPITIVFGWPKGIISEIEKPYHRLLPFIHYRVESFWFLLVPLFFLICFVWFFLKTGKDPKGRGAIAPEFEIPENLTPAEMGTILDEKASNREITATIIDLAVRGFLEIEDLGEKGFLKNKDFLFKRTEKSETGLKNYEKKILEAIFLDNKEIKLSVLKKKNGQRIRNFLDEAKEKIYEATVSNNLFTALPTKVRTKYFALGCSLLFVALFFLILIVILDKFSIILILDFALIGLILIIFAWFMPQKTKKGVLLKERILGFKMYMEKAEKYRSQWQEKENILERFLPYAVLFGITKQWLKSLKNIGLSVEKNFEKANFYTGTYAFVDLPNSLDNLTINIDSSVSSVSSSVVSGGSGFSGGGSFGGGFGGGGGGSW